MSGVESRALSGGAELTLRFDRPLGPKWSFLAEGRGAMRAHVVSEDGEDALAPRGFAELRSLYAEYKDKEIRLRLGRQKFKEDTGLWWNRAADGAAISGSGHGCAFQAGVAGHLSSWRTGADLRPDEEDVIRGLGEVSCAYRPGHVIETRIALAADGARAELTAEDPLTFNDREGHMAWAGLRLAGREDAFSYRLDVMGRAGEETQNERTPAGLVIGRRDRDVAGWAADAAVEIPVAQDWAVQARYSYARGDDGEGSDASFRQTGLHRNKMAMGGLSRPMEGFGLALRPELSNLHVAAVGLARRWGPADGAIVYRRYLIDQPGGEIYADGGGRLIGWQSRDLGQGFDAALNLDVERALGLDLGARDLDLRAAAGFLRKGAAYGTQAGDYLGRWFLELKLSF